ncbi:hypothetical protein GCM10010187_69170 [Actinomadura coerulea]|nr:hypothetical protein GCM10010187_69170 [Actinomadura coerulea]
MPPPARRTPHRSATAVTIISPRPLSSSSPGARTRGLPPPPSVSSTRTRAARDSKDPEGPVLQFGAHDWAAFLARIKRGTGR